MFLRRISVLVLILALGSTLLYGQSMFRRAGRWAPSGGAAAWGGPYYEDFDLLAPGADLGAQAAWTDFGAGADDYPIAAKGVENNEATWGNYSVCSYTGGDSCQPDMQAFVVFYAQGASGADFGVAVRVNAAGNTFYSWAYEDNGDALRLYKTVSGTSSQLDFVSQTVADNDTLKLVASNDTLYAYYNSTLKLTTYDASISTGGWAGVAAKGDGQSMTIKNWGWDEFSW